MTDTVLEMAFQGRMDMGTIDTTPGAKCVFAPPEGVTLTSEDYLDLMRKRYRMNPASRQQMRVYARRLGHTEVVGPWITEARRILGAIGK